MNILYLAHRIPYPPNKGDKLRAFRQLQHLAKNHRVWCACFLDDADDWQHVETLRAYCHELAVVPLGQVRAAWRCAKGLLNGETLTESHYADPKMQRVLDNWAGNIRFSAVVAFSSSMAPFALRIPSKRRVLDMCDLDSQKWLAYARQTSGLRRSLYATEGRRLTEREQRWLQEFDATILITQAEANAATWSDQETRGKLHIVGNGVDLKPVLPSPTGAPETKSAQRPRGLKPAARALRTGDAQIVGFVGVMNYRPNADAVCWFVEQCWPTIRRAVPDATFRIVGRSPARRVQRLAKIPGVVVTGSVPDAKAEVAQFDVSVAPMRIARGLQNKVLEAMAAAKPVVLSSAAALAINAKTGQEYVIADDPSAIAERVITLLRDPERRHRIGSDARAFVAAHHNWETELDKFEGIVIGSASAKPPLNRPLGAATQLDGANACVIT